MSRDELLVEAWGYQPGIRSRAPDRAQPVAQLWPPRQDGFVGRDGLRTELAAWLTSRHALMAVVGPPGAGGSRRVEEIVGTNAVVVRWEPGNDAKWFEPVWVPELVGVLEETAGSVIVLDDTDADGLGAAAEVVLPRLRRDELRLCVSTTTVPAWTLPKAPWAATPYGGRW